MMKFYNLIMQISVLLLKCVSTVSSKTSSNKLALFAHGQQQLIQRIQEDMKQSCKHCPIIWLHASSLGEYAVARPIVKRLKQDGNCKIVLTFFSPTGVEALKKHHPYIDYVYYLPIDTRENARLFLEAVQPDRAVFIISEQWCNYLSELKRRNVPTYLVSALIRKDSTLMKWYGGFIRKQLSAYTHISVLNHESQLRLSSIGYQKVTVTGDPLFDNAHLVAEQDWHDRIVERFTHGRKVFIAGSISDEKDLSLMSRLANEHPETHFIFVPHEISEEKLNHIKYELRHLSKLYSECDETTDFSSIQVLIIDFLGALPYLYRYAQWAYVGGGFTPLLHSVIEATVYGIPVAFGPNIKRKVTPNQLQELRIGQVVKNYSELADWFSTLQNDEKQLQRIRSVAAKYVNKNLGATDTIIQIIETRLWE